MQRIIGIIVVFLLMGAGLEARGQSIGSVSKDGNYLEIYDANGDRLCRDYVGDVSWYGYSSQMYAIKDGNYIEIYNAECDRFLRDYIGDATPQNVVGNKYIIKDGNYIETYNSEGDRLDRRYE